MHDPSNMMYAIEDFWLRHKTKLAATFISLMVFLWLTGMTAGITAAACRKERTEPEKRVAFCTISLTAGFTMDIFPREYRRRSFLQLERGIAYLQSDQLEKARADFAQAIHVMLRYHQNEAYRDAHMRRIASHPDPRVEPFWRATLDAMIAKAESAEAANRVKAAE